MKHRIRVYAQAQEAWAIGRHLDCGRLIFNALSPVQRVAWASRILRFCLLYSSSTPEIVNIAAMVDDQHSWTNAHDAFSKVRAITLAAERAPSAFEPQFRSLLYVAENAAKVIYNASDSSAPFDEDAGWWLAPCLAHFLSVVNEPNVSSEGLRVLLSPVAASAA